MRKLTIARLSNEEMNRKKKVIKLDLVKPFEQVFIKPPSESRRSRFSNWTSREPNNPGSHQIRDEFTRKNFSEIFLSLENPPES